MMRLLSALAMSLAVSGCAMTKCEKLENTQVGLTSWAVMASLGAGALAPVIMAWPAAEILTRPNGSACP